MVQKPPGRTGFGICAYHSNSKQTTGTVAGAENTTASSNSGNITRNTNATNTIAHRSATFTRDAPEYA